MAEASPEPQTSAAAATSPPAAPTSDVRFTEGTMEDAATHSALYTCEWLPAAQQQPRALFFIVHGLHEHIGRYRMTAEFLARRGIAVFGMDLPAHGHTTLDNASRGLIADIDPVAWAVCRRVRDVVQTRFHNAVPAFLFGHSLGSLIAFACLSRLASPATDTWSPVKLAGFIVTGMCNPQPNGLLKALVTMVSVVIPSLVVVPLSPDGLTTKPDVKEDYLHDPLNKISGVMARTALAMTRCAAANLVYAQSLAADAAKATEAPPMLFMHGSIDPLCTLSEARVLFNALPQSMREGGRAEMRVFDGAKHEILNDICGDQVREHLAQWLEARFDALQQQPASASVAPAIVEVASPTVAATSQ